MRVLLSTIGSRGDVEPLVALALQLRETGHEVRLCIPPGFDPCLHGLPFVPIGHDLRLGPRKVPGGPAATAAAQFEVIGGAAADCDAIVGCAAMQIAGPSIAEKRDIPYFYAAYAPVSLPSTHHPPPPVYGPPRPAGTDNSAMWELDAQWWNDTWLPAVNAQRVAIGLPPVRDVRDYVLTDRPLLAADPTLAPWPPTEADVVQTGAWLRTDARPLTEEVQRFLEAGDPPILFGFGSILKPRAAGPAMLAAARALGYRAIILRGWAGLTGSDASPDWLSVGEVNLQALLARVAAIVHHGGSGTTTQAMRAGVPQVLVPHHFDQPYFGKRVTALGIGTACSDPDPDSLVDALHTVLTEPVRTRALSLAGAVRTDGAAAAAREILGR